MILDHCSDCAAWDASCGRCWKVLANRLRAEGAAAEREALREAIEDRYEATDDETAIDILKLIRARGEPASPETAKATCFQCKGADTREIRPGVWLCNVCQADDEPKPDARELALKAFREILGLTGADAWGDRIDEIASAAIAALEGK